MQKRNLFSRGTIDLADYYRYSKNLLLYYKKLKELVNLDDRVNLISKSFKKKTKALFISSFKIEILYNSEIKPTFNSDEFFKIIANYETLYGVLRSTKDVSVVEVNCIPKQIIQLKSHQVALLGTINNSQNHINIFNFTTRPFDFLFKSNLNLPSAKPEPTCMTTDAHMLYMFVNEGIEINQLICMPLDEKNTDSAVFIPLTKRCSHMLAHEGLLYACQQDEPKVIVIDLKTFQVIREHRLTLNPIQIQAIGNVACVRSSPTDTNPKTMFVKLDTFEVISQFSVLNGCIFVFKENFYIFQDNFFCMFSPTGNFLKKYPFNQDFGEIMTIINLHGNIIFCLLDKFVIFYSDHYVNNYLN